MKIQRADWVCCKGQPQYTGIVKRIAADGAWADVDWGTHRKRMQTSVLDVVHTLTLGGSLNGWTVTDMDAKRRVEVVAR